MQLSHSKEKLFNDLHPTLELTVQFRLVATVNLPPERKTSIDFPNLPPNFDGHKL